MSAFRIVEALDVIEHVGLGFIPHSIRPARRSLSREKLSIAALSQTLPDAVVEHQLL
jgi:hypothetical protein